MLTSPSGHEFTYALKFNFNTLNNDSEYEALLAGLRIAKTVEVKRIKVFTNSLLVASQVRGEYTAKEEPMKLCLALVNQILIYFTSFSITQIPRGQNQGVDALSKLAALTFEQFGKEVLVEVINEKSIFQPAEVSQVETEDTWRLTSLIGYPKVFYHLTKWRH